MEDLFAGGGKGGNVRTGGVIGELAGSGEDGLRESRDEPGEEVFNSVEPGGNVRATKNLLSGCPSTGWKSLRSGILRPVEERATKMRHLPGHTLRTRLLPVAFLLPPMTLDAREVHPRAFPPSSCPIRGGHRLIVAGRVDAERGMSVFHAGERWGGFAFSGASGAIWIARGFRGCLVDRGHRWCRSRRRARGEGGRCEIERLTRCIGGRLGHGAKRFGEVVLKELCELSFYAASRRTREPCRRLSVGQRRREERMQLGIDPPHVASTSPRVPHPVPSETPIVCEPYSLSDSTRQRSRGDAVYRLGKPSFSPPPCRAPPRPRIRSHAVSVQALTPTPILDALTIDSFTSPEATSLVVAKPDRVEVWDADKTGLVWRVELELWGSVIGIEKVILRVSPSFRSALASANVRYRRMLARTSSSSYPLPTPIFSFSPSPLHQHHHSS